MPVVLHAQKITKTYGPQRVLDGVSFELAAGETAAFVGENGAGKSTMAKILAGATTPDAGQILLNGAAVHFSSPRDALAHGIAFIPQELVYVPKLTVAENIALGRWPRRAGLTSATAIRRQAASEARRFGFDLPLDVEMASLSLAQQQMVEILKAVARRSSVILLDEPTAALNNEDADGLLSIMSDLAKSGVAVLYISHRLDEVFRACDTVHVLRNGQLVLGAKVADTTPSELVAAMLGRSEEGAVVSKAGSSVGRPVLEIDAWQRRATPELHGISLRVCEREIVGLYGVRGSGAETVAEALGGLHRDVQGQLQIDRRSVGMLTSPLASKRAGIAYVPADRKSQGLVLTSTVQRSLAMLVWRRLSAGGIVSAAREREVASQTAASFRIRTRGLGQAVGELSGGNQQKVLVGSRLAVNPRLLVLQEPTRGVDVGARLEIHRTLRQLADDGMATLVVTSDIEEATMLCDRLLIIRNGQFVEEITDPSGQSKSRALHSAGGVD